MRRAVLILVSVVATLFLVMVSWSLSEGWEADQPFDTLIAELSKTAIPQIGGAKGKGFVDEKAKFIATFVFYNEAHPDVEWEFEILNWSKDITIEVFKLKAGGYHILYAHVVWYEIIEDHWLSYLNYFKEFPLPEDEAGSVEETIAAQFHRFIDSKLSGMDANAACIEQIREKIKQQEERQDENPRPEPQGDQGSGQIA